MTDEQQGGDGGTSAQGGGSAAHAPAAPDPGGVSTGDASGAATDAAIGARGGGSPVMLPDASADGAEGDDIDDAPSGGTIRR
jgi:hypothetical protein